MTIADRAHAALAVVGIIIAGLAAAATVVAEGINLLGGHVTGIQVTALTTAAAAGIVGLSKLIDSLNDAIKGAAAVKATTVTTALASGTAGSASNDAVTAALHSLGQQLVNYGTPPPLP